MRRMIDNKKLKELEANGGTKWYKHAVQIASDAPVNISVVFFSMFGDSLKDTQLPLGLYPAIITQASGPSAPNTENFLPGLKIYTNGRFMLNYVGNDGKIKQYEFNKSSINSEVVTRM